MWYLYISDDWLALFMCYLWIFSDWLAPVMWFPLNFRISRSWQDLYSTKSAKFLAYKMQWIYNDSEPVLIQYTYVYTRTMHSKGRIPWLAIIYPIYSILNPTVDEWKRCSWYSQATTCLTRSHLLGDSVQESHAKDKRKPREVTCVVHPKKR